MIEPYVTEKQCQTCKQCKPITEFHNQATSPGGKKPNCKVCANADCRARYQKKVERGGKRNRDGRRNPSLPLSPLPNMTMMESLDCNRFRKWRGPVEHGQRRARL